MYIYIYTSVDPCIYMHGVRRAEQRGAEHSVSRVQLFQTAILNSRLEQPSRTHRRHRSRLEQPLRAHWRHRAGSMRRRSSLCANTRHFTCSEHPKHANIRVFTCFCVFLGRNSESSEGPRSAREGRGPAREHLYRYIYIYVYTICTCLSTYAHICLI